MIRGCDIIAMLPVPRKSGCTAAVRYSLSIQSQQDEQFLHAGYFRVASDFGACRQALTVHPDRGHPGAVCPGKITARFIL
jgi:hypothetical protein